MKENTEKICRKAKEKNNRKNISNKMIVSRKNVAKRIKITYERKSIKVPVSFIVPEKTLKKESDVRFSRPDVFIKAVISKRSLSKFIAAFLIVAVNWFSILTIVGTDAYFNDVETSQDNFFSATKLDFSISMLRSDGFRTQTQGGWGNKGCNDKTHGNKSCGGNNHGNNHGDNAGTGNNETCGDNAGSYRDANFDDAFAGGLTIGNEASGYYAHFSSSQAIENFLPAGKTPGHFSQSHEDPTETEAGVLAGQVLSLALNVGFDNFDPDFGVNEDALSDFHASELGTSCEKMTLNSDMTVGEILAEANLVLSGQSSEFSPAEMNDCVTEINERFDNGVTVKITPAESVWKEITVVKHEGLNFQNVLKVEQISGDIGLCEALNVDAYLVGYADTVYSGNLLDLVYDPLIFSDSANKLRLDISLPPDAPSSLINKICGLRYVISGWQENIVVQDGGFSDVEEISDSIESGEWESADEKLTGLGFVVMNELLPNPEGREYGFDFGKDSDHMPKGEWIELYNNGDVAFDLAGWYFKDLAGNTRNISNSNSSSGSTIIPAKDWMVVYMNKEMLNNSGSETITLFDGDDDTADSYSYSGNDYCDLAPTSGDVNDEIPSGHCSGVPKNKSYARIPDGVGAWIDPIPTPGETNITEENIVIAALESAIFEKVQPDAGSADAGVISLQENISDLGLVSSVNFSDAMDESDSVNSVNSDFTAEDEIVDPGNIQSSMEISDPIIDLGANGGVTADNLDVADTTTGVVDVLSEDVSYTIDNEDLIASDEVAADDPVINTDPVGDKGISDDGGETIQATDPEDVIIEDQTQSLVGGDQSL